MGSPQAPKGVIAWFIANPVAANLLMIAFVVLGFMSLQGIRTEFMPKLEGRGISISASLPGGSPAELEEAITLKLENIVRQVPGVKNTKASTSDSHARVAVVVEDDFDVDKVMRDIKNYVDSINNLPADVENLIVKRIYGTELAIQLTLYGQLGERKAKLLLEEIRRELTTTTNVRSVFPWGIRPYQVNIEIEEEKLQQYGLILNDVARRVRAESVNLPGGVLKSPNGYVAIRAEGQAYDRDDYENIVLLSSEDGRTVYLRDVAKITDGFVDWKTHAFFDDQFAVGLSVSALGQQDAVTVANEVKAYVKRKQKELPPGVYIKETADITYYLSSRLSLMSDNMMYGALLVFLILACFMQLKIAFWVMLGLPVCYLGAFIIMPLEFVNVSLNMISMFGFILVLGIIVDDAIVVGESVNAEIEKKGLSHFSVWRGTKNVSMASVFGVATTMVAFVPTLLVEGAHSAMPYSVGVVVITTLFFSLIESKLILPAHLASMHSGIWRYLESKRQNAFQLKNNQRLEYFLESYYLPFLLISIKRRYFSLLTFLSIFVIAISLFTGGIVKYELMPALPHDYLEVKVKMGFGSDETETLAVMDRVRDGLFEVNEAYIKETGDADGFVLHVARALQGQRSGTFFIELSKDENRQVDSFEIVERWQNTVGKVENAEKISFSAFRSSGSRGLSYLFVGADKVALEQAAGDFHMALSELEGLYDVQDSSEGSRIEYVLSLKPKAIALNLTLAELSVQVKAAFYGIEAERFQRGSDEVKVMVRYPEHRRQDLIDLENMHIKTRDSRFIPLKELADIRLERAPSTLKRVNYEAASSVTAKVSKSVEDVSALYKVINKELLPEILDRYPSVSYRRDGYTLEKKKLEGNFPVYFILVVLAVYVLLAIPLKSYTQPFIIMSAIPFGIVGAILGHLMLGYAISLMSIFGIIALTGVVVNDSLLMVDFVNRAKLAGSSTYDAALDAGSKRFRAIFLTTVTTFIGLLPMLLEHSIQAESMVPMAVSLGFGIVFATAITLILVPCLYVILEDLKAVLYRLGIIEAA